MIDIQLIELGRRRFIDLSQIKRPVMISVPHSEDVGGAVGASLHCNRRGRDQRGDDDSNARSISEILQINFRPGLNGTGPESRSGSWATRCNI